MRCTLVWMVFVVGCGAGASRAPAPAQPVANVAAQPSEPVGAPAGYVELRASKVVALGDDAAVILVDDPPRVAVPIFIGGTEGASIDYRLRGEKPPRPLTHDLLDNMVRKLGGEIVKVQIDSIRDGVFHASVFVRQNGRVLRIGSRSSDAIALAIGNHVPIYVAQAVIDEAGVSPDLLRQQMGQGPLPVTS